jgi:hypothetical protein
LLSTLPAIYVVSLTLIKSSFTISADVQDARGFQASIAPLRWYGNGALR